MTLEMVGIVYTPSDCALSISLIGSPLLDEEAVDGQNRLWFARHASILERARNGAGRPFIVGTCILQHLYPEFSVR